MFSGRLNAVSRGDGVEAAHGEGDDAGAVDAAGAGVAVSGASGVDLVAAADEVEAGLDDAAVEEVEAEVSVDGEDVGDADLDVAAAHGGFAGAEVGKGGGDLPGPVMYDSPLPDCVPTVEDLNSLPSPDPVLMARNHPTVGEGADVVAGGQIG